ncbi:MAG: acetate/propionate family kinase [Verrucomicrobiia bacterium]|jgi:acetate kinase
MKILVANIGSTSLKWRLFDFGNGAEQLLHRGGFERVSDYSKAVQDCIDELTGAGVIHSLNDIAGVGFKTVLAKDVTGCVRLDEAVLKAMEEVNSVAPAHNPPYIKGIRIFAERMPGVPLVGLFEDAFYQWAPEAAIRYAVPEQWHRAGIRRHGFHGASHKYIAERSAELLGREDVATRARLLYVNGASGKVNKPDLRVISCHLGGSSSVSGILNGVAIGNSLGMSPQSGLPHNNRVGDLDPFAIPYAIRAMGLTLDEVERVLCKESGLKGVSGISNDIRDITKAAEEGNSRARLALDLLIYTTRHWVGAYFFEMGGADAIVFTAGIGENHSGVRAGVCAGLESLGIEIDKQANENVRAREAVISKPGSKVKVMVIPTNEELVVAREVKRFLDKNR